MLLKKPESTTSRPVIPRVQAAIQSFDTIPSTDRSSKTSQYSSPRIVIADSGRTSG